MPFKLTATERCDPETVSSIGLAERLQAGGALSIPEFATLMGIGRTKAFAEAAAGRLRTFKVGSRTLIAAPDAIAWRDRLRLQASGAEAA